MTLPALNGRQVVTSELNRRRRLAVKLRLEGATLAEAARKSGLSEPTVVAACKAHASGGLRAVSVRLGGRKPGNGARLDVDQQLEIQLTLDVTLPIDHGLGGHLWSVDIVRQLILQLAGVVLSLRTVARYLDQWGFVAEHQEVDFDESLESTSWTLKDFRWPDNKARYVGGLLRWAEYRELPALQHSARGEGRSPDSREVAEDDPRYFVYLATMNGSIQWQSIEDPRKPEALGRFLEIAQQDIGRRLVVVAYEWPFDVDRNLELWNKRHEGAVEVVEGYARSRYRRFAR